MAPPTTPWVRDITSDVDGVKNTFSSWDSCMAEDYCKYPVIVAIVVVSLIVLSFLFCIIRCACCGLECCCGCMSCCNACCPSPRGGNKRAKFADQPNWGGAPANAGYGGGYQPTAPPVYNPPAQYAQFDVSKPVHADSLPAMPSWDAAASRKVLNEQHDADAVEMDHMHPHHGDEQAAPMLAHQAPAPGTSSPHPDSFIAAAPSPYGHQHQGPDSDAYSQQDHSDPLQRYGGAAAASNRLSSGARPYSPQSSFSAGPTAYGTTAVGAGHQSPYGHDVSAYGSSTNASYYDHAPAGPPHRAVSPPAPAPTSPTGGSFLPGALQAGGRTPQPATSYQPYSAYAPAGQQSHQGAGYSAYTPNQGGYRDV